MILAGGPDLIIPNPTATTISDEMEALKNAFAKELLSAEQVVV
jgi:hypothetical protein